MTYLTPTTKKEIQYLVASLASRSCTCHTQKCCYDLYIAVIHIQGAKKGLVQANVLVRSYTEIAKCGRKDTINLQQAPK